MKRTLCILLSIILAVTGLVGLGMSAGAANYHVGDIIEFGSYPQTEVKDPALVAVLNALPGTWQSYGYYVGTDGGFNGEMAPSDFMKFCDVLYNGQRYRGVQFSKYRSYSTDMSANATSGSQLVNGYQSGRVYWFSYEPLKWRVLDPSTGLVLCESIIDSQPYHSFVLYDQNTLAYYGSPVEHRYANNYQYSTIRQWLNLDFKNTAFSAAEENAVKVTTVVNAAYDTSYSQFGCSTTYDLVFMLSYKDVQKTAYGFKADPDAKDPARLAKGTDYAKCQGLAVTKAYAYWQLRTAGHNGYTECAVRDDGSTSYAIAVSINRGVRPAVTLDLTKYAVLNAPLNVPEDATVGYKSTVTVTATAEDLPEGFVVALYDGDTQLAKGDNTTVTYKMDKMKASKTLTAKVIDLNNNVQSNADGKLEKEIKITVKTGFFDKLIAFFKGLFGLLPKVELKP